MAKEKKTSIFIVEGSSDKEGLHSLERHTNLHIYFKTYPNPDGLL